MAISMQDFLNERASGNTVNPEDVRLSFNEMAKLSRLQAVDPRRSGYGGLAQAQEITADIPGPQDLGLMVEQNKQLQAAGGLGYSGTMHGTYGKPTPFDKLTEQIQESKEDFGHRTGHVAPTGTVGEGSGSLGRGRGGDGDSEGRYGGSSDRELGHFGREAMTDWSMDLGKKGLLGATALYGMGAPAGMAAKAGLLSSISPLGILAGLGKAVYGGALDMATDQRAADYDSAPERSMSAEEAALGSSYADEQAGQTRMGRNMAQALASGVDVYSDDYNTMGKSYGLPTDPRSFMSTEDMAIQDIEEMSPMDRVKAAGSALIEGPKGGWMSSKNIDKTTGLHEGMIDSAGYADMAAVADLESTFGDPMGTGLGPRSGYGGPRGGFGGRDDSEGDSGGSDGGFSGGDDAGGNSGYGR